MQPSANSLKLDSHLQTPYQEFLVGFFCSTRRNFFNIVHRPWSW